MHRLDVAVVALPPEARSPKPEAPGAQNLKITWPHELPDGQPGGGSSPAITSGTAMEVTTTAAAAPQNHGLRTKPGTWNWPLRGGLRRRGCSTLATWA